MGENENVFEGENVGVGGYEPTTPPKCDGSDREQPPKRPRDVAEEKLAPGPGDADDPEDPDDDPDGGYVPGLEGNMLYQHECHGHWPYGKGCDACVQACGRTPPRRRKRKDNQQTIGCGSRES